MKVYFPVSGLTDRVAAQDVPRTLTPGVLNTFATNIEVNGYELLGFTTLTPGIGCGFGPMGEQFEVSSGTDTPIGDLVNFSSESGERLNISARAEPTNTFSLSAITRNRKKGTATLVVNDLQNPGVLTASGKGVKAAGAIVPASVPATAMLVIKPKGKARAKLNQTSKVALNAEITFTPIDGNGRSISAKVKLKKL